MDFFDPAFDSEMIFGTCEALVYVIDAQVRNCLREGGGGGLFHKDEDLL